MMMSDLSTMLLNEEGLNQMNEVLVSHEIEDFCTIFLKQVKESLNFIDRGTQSKVVIELKLKISVIAKEGPYALNACFGVYQRGERDGRVRGREQSK